MTQSLRLVEYFTSEFYRDKTSVLEHIISPTFVYKLNSRPDENFQQYAARRMLVDEKATVVLGKLETKDDINFKATYVVTNKHGESATGVVIIRVEKNLLQEVHVKSDLTDENYRMFEKSML